MRKMLRDILFYSGGNMLGRIITALLLPITTNYLSPADYGAIAILMLATMFFNGVLTLGFQTSLGGVFSREKEPEKQQGIIWTAFMALIANNLVWIVTAFIFSRSLSKLLLGSEMHYNLITLAFLGAGICPLRLSFEYYLRFTGQSEKIFCLNLFDVIQSISIMLFEVVWLHKGVQGFMEACAISQTINLVAVLLLIAPKVTFSFQKNHLKELLCIGFPCTYGFLGYCTLQGVSRYILQIFGTEEQVGLYYSGSSIGRVIELPLWGFMSVWTPFSNSFIHKEKEAPCIFSRMATYYLSGMSLFIVPLFCLSRPIVHALVQPPFHDVWKVVGLTAVSHTLWGAYALISVPLLFRKKTGILSLLELGAASWCILANLMLVPFFQIQGAAWATLLGFLSLIFASLCINQRILYIPYDTQRIGKIILAVAVTGMVSFIPIHSALVYNALMGMTLTLFYAFCWHKILSPEERHKIHTFIFSKLKPYPTC